MEVPFVYGETGQINDKLVRDLAIFVFGKTGEIDAILVTV
jgi:hypothetical protein